MVSTSLLSAALLSAALGSLVPPPLSRRALFAAAAGLPALTQLPASALAAAGCEACVADFTDAALLVHLEQRAKQV